MQSVDFELVQLEMTLTRCWVCGQRYVGGLGWSLAFSQEHGLNEYSKLLIQHPGVLGFWGFGVLGFWGFGFRV